MKTFFTIGTLLTTTLFFAQAFSGDGDVKFNIGVNTQADATGVSGIFVYGVGENISVGVQGIYLLAVEDYEAQTSGAIENPKFQDRFDIRARLNANLGSVLNISEALEVYPGLSLGLKNFGAHFGVRYFFSSGFGLFGEIQAPIAKYNEDELLPAVAPRKELNNQFNVTIGASFNL
jgi:outer membrane protein G